MPVYFCGNLFLGELENRARFVYVLHVVANSMVQAVQV